MNPAAPLVRSEIADTTIRGLIDAQLDQIDRTRSRNQLKERYYEAKQRVQASRVIPPAWQSVRAAVGWPGTAVDVLEERLDFLGWTGNDVLQAAYDDNNLAVESGLAHLDALVFGCAFVAIDPHAGADGLPDLVTAESPLEMTGVWDGGKRRLTNALLIAERDSTGAPRLVTWWDDVETGHLRKVGQVWRWEDRRPHGSGACPVVQLVNRPRASRLGGRSEISRSVRDYTDSAVRTLIGLETNRDFYSFPQRWSTNVPKDAFKDPVTGEDLPGWMIAMASMNIADPPAPGEPETKFGTFAANPPTPYLDQVRGLAQLFAAEAAIPPHYLGFQTDNPASADAIRAGEARLVKRSERRQMTFGWGWRQIGELLLAARGQDFAGIGCKWRDPATPTRAATADEVMKLIGVRVLQPTSTVTYDRLGFSLPEQDQLRRESQAAAADATVQALAQAAANVTPQTRELALRSDTGQPAETAPSTTPEGQ